MGIPNIYRTPTSTIDDQINESIFDDGPRQEFFNSCLLDTGEYWEMLQDKDNELYDAFCYLTYIVRSSWEDVEAFIASTIGEYLDEIDIPMTEIEEEFFEEYEDEDDEEE